ncbi:MAG: hypothetical protein DRH04_01560 [Deltaproteobacteria bacterium]|nr:MAG: hypothetical protein DRH04_01560 [Deltaproteobacteria bacterium]
MKSFYRGKSLLFGAVALLLVLLLGFWSISKFIDYEKRRDLNSWQLTLGVMADQKAHEIDSWLERQFAVLQELARNGSLQLYTQQLRRSQTQHPSVESAEISYLRNLILATAERHGFTDRGEPASSRIGANIMAQADNSLALIANGDSIITGTVGISKPTPGLRQKILEVLQRGETSLLDVYVNANNRPVVAFLVPVFALQKQSNALKPIAVLCGTKDVSQALYPLLRSRHAATKTDECYLIRKRGDLVQYLSPLADGTLPLKKSLAANAPDLAAGVALQSPGWFGNGKDYAGNDVLFTSRKIAGSPWILVQKIHAREALAGSRSHQRFLLLSLSLVLLLAASLLIAFWWYGGMLESQRVAADLQAKTELLASRTALLAAVSDNIHDFIFILNQELHFIFANRSLADRLSIPAEDMKNKNLASAFGPASARILERLCQKSLKEGSLSQPEISLEMNGEHLVFNAAFIPVAQPESDRQVLLISLHDITLLHEMQQKRERLRRQLVAALMRAIDLHDPYSANHSANTAFFASAIGRSMNLEPDALETVETAANLCNLGKLSIPKQVLTKTGALTAEEQELMRKEPEFARELLGQIDFDGPVCEAVAQKYECLDGSGYPDGLSAEQVIFPARILAVANAFVAMISPRAYRDRFAVADALDQLLKQAGSKYDRQVVAALFHVVENETNWSQWDERQQKFIN